MSDLITLQGVVLSSMPVGEYDRRLVLLTRQRGRISCFAKGARRPKSPLMAASGPFVFGNFTLYEGRSSYNLQQVEITHQFMDLTREQPGIYYGYYFLELAEYFGREGIDGRDVLNLLYVTLRALLNNNIDDRLIRCIYELRTMTVHGMMPALYTCAKCGRTVEDTSSVWFSQSMHGISCAVCPPAPDAFRILPGTLAALRHIVSAPMGKLYTFSVTEEILRELEKVAHPYLQAVLDKPVKSLDILKVML